MAQAQQAGQPNIQQPKKVGKNRFSHTANTTFLTSDNYGSAIPAKIGKYRENGESIPISPNKLKTPPKKLG